jgi:hypothetical protein
MIKDLSTLIYVSVVAPVQQFALLKQLAKNKILCTKRNRWLLLPVLLTLYHQIFAIIAVPVNQNVLLKQLASKMIKDLSTLIYVSVVAPVQQFALLKQLAKNKTLCTK